MLATAQRGLATFVASVQRSLATFLATRIAGLATFLATLGRVWQRFWRALIGLASGRNRSGNLSGNAVAGWRA
jgi:hypothetical protein